MAIAADYPITTGYGQIPGYPLNGGFHRGQDRYMPIGTPVPVNGVTIGLSGNSGAVSPKPTPANPNSGQHLHIGKWQGDTVMNPNGGGFALSNPTVTYTGYDATNGYHIKLLDDKGITWLYDHLSEIKVNLGDKIGGNDVSTVGEVEFNNLYIAFFGPMEVNPPTTDDRKRWVGAETNTVIRAMQADPRHPAWLAYVESLKQSSQPYTQLKPGNYKV